MQIWNDRFGIGGNVLRWLGAAYVNEDDQPRVRYLHPIGLIGIILLASIGFIAHALSIIPDLWEEIKDSCVPW